MGRPKAPKVKAPRAKRVAPRLPPLPRVRKALVPKAKVAVEKVKYRKLPGTSAIYDVKELAKYHSEFSPVTLGNRLLRQTRDQRAAFVKAVGVSDRTVRRWAEKGNAVNPEKEAPAVRHPDDIKKRVQAIWAKLVEDEGYKATHSLLQEEVLEEEGVTVSKSSLQRWVAWRDTGVHKPKAPKQERASNQPSYYWAALASQRQ
jgi:transposase